MKLIHFAKILFCNSIIACTFFQISAQKPEPKPNIVVIMTDQQSADAMSNRLGSTDLKTPNIDYLADHGITYTNVYCANPLCVPSRSSMFTGRYPHEVGIQTNDNEKKLNPAEFQTMGTIFIKAGYETGYVGKWHLPYNENEKISHGFEYMAQNKAKGSDALIPDAAVQFINQKHDKPFLLIVSFCNPHNICEWARGQELPDGPIGIPPAVEFCPPLLANHAPAKNESDIVTLLRNSAHASPMFPVGIFDDTKWRQYRWAYYRMIEKVDSEIGKILDVLRNTGIDKNTVIVFLSDHGDSQRAHLLNQKTNFYEEAAKVPFIISAPGMKKPEISTKLIQTGIDLIPTMCDFAGITVPSELPGLSVRKNAEDKKAGVSRPFIVSSVKPIQGNAVNGIKPEPDGRMVRGEHYKYWIYSEGKQRESLFDIKNDPGEMVNLASNSNYKTVLMECRKQLETWCTKYSDPFSQYLLK